MIRQFCVLQDLPLMEGSYVGLTKLPLPTQSLPPWGHLSHACVSFSPDVSCSEGLEDIRRASAEGLGVGIHFGGTEEGPHNVRLCGETSVLGEDW